MPSARWWLMTASHCGAIEIHAVGGDGRLSYLPSREPDALTLGRSGLVLVPSDHAL
jgi:hypothetical protein